MAPLTTPDTSVSSELEKTPDLQVDGTAVTEPIDTAILVELDNSPTLTAKSTRFWLVFVSLCLTAFTANLNATILSTVIPLIVRDLHAEDEFIWINASFAIAAATIQPLCGQVSNIFGRRYPMLMALGLFTLGSGICGGANSVGMLIAGRTVQGLGGGGLMMLLEIIVCDLLPLRERAQYLGVILSVASLGVAVGPTIGGAFANKNQWRWCFYISVPIGAVGFILAAVFLRLKNPPKTSLKSALARVDAVGNVIFIASSCSILLGLTMGGQIYAWSSPRVYVPILLGALGWILFGFHQGSNYCKEPTMPLRLFSNRTAVSGFFLVFISCMLLEWTVYYLPYYFQALKGSSPLYSSVQVLPFNLFLIPSAMINGGLLAKFGQYKPIHWAGFAMFTIGAGLFSTMDTSTSTVKWVFWQLFAAWGLGGLIMSTLPAIQASLPESDVATSTGTHAFIRSFGFVWGFTIPSLVFNNRVRANINLIDDATVRATIAKGEAYSQANGPLLASLSEKVKDQLLQIYTISLRDLWYTAFAFSLLGFLLVFFEKKIKLREELKTEFGLEDKSNEKSEDAEATA
jgi:EmrB/QacA subfamily drug resistance transporter